MANLFSGKISCSNAQPLPDKVSFSDRLQVQKIVPKLIKPISFGSLSSLSYCNPSEDIFEDEHKLWLEVRQELRDNRVVTNFAAKEVAQHFLHKRTSDDRASKKGFRYKTLRNSHKPTKKRLSKVDLTLTKSFKNFLAAEEPNLKVVDENLNKLPESSYLNQSGGQTWIKEMCNSLDAESQFFTDDANFNMTTLQKSTTQAAPPRSADFHNSNASKGGSITKPLRDVFNAALKNFDDDKEPNRVACDGSASQAFFSAHWMMDKIEREKVSTMDFKRSNEETNKVESKKHKSGKTGCSHHDLIVDFSSQPRNKRRPSTFAKCA